MICAVLYAEPTNSADVGQTLLETREAAFLGATKGATILRTPRIIGFGRCSNDDDADANCQYEQQVSQGRLLGVRP